MDGSQLCRKLFFTLKLFFPEPVELVGLGQLLEIIDPLHGCPLAVVGDLLQLLPGGTAIHQLILELSFP